MLDKDTRIKLLLVGDPGTGKSALVSYWGSSHASLLGKIPEEEKRL